MRVRGNVSPAAMTLEPYSPLPGYVELRLRENINQVTVENTQDEGKPVTMYEYDEYTFHIKNREGLKKDVQKNMADWLTTGRTLEVNESASIVADMKKALEILGVKDDE